MRTGDYFQAWGSVGVSRCCRAIFGGLYKVIILPGLLNLFNDTMMLGEQNQKMIRFARKLQSQSSVFSLIYNPPNPNGLQFRLARNLLKDESPQNVGFAGEFVKLRWCKTSLLNDTVQSSQLLGSVRVTLCQLVEDLNIVLGVLILGLGLQVSSSLGSFTSNFSNAGATSELSYNGVQGFNGTSSSIKSTAWYSVCARLAVNE